MIRDLFRSGLELALAAAISFSPYFSRAESNAPCFDAFADGQRLAKKNELRAARDRLRACLDDTSCPAPPLLKDCLDEYRAVDARIGSIVVEATDASGAPLTDVVVTIDGNKATEHLDGKAIDLDPGAHVVVLHAAKKKDVEKKLLVGEGDKLRRVAVTMEDLVAKPSTETKTTIEAPRSHGPSTTVWILGAVGAVGVIAFGTIGLLGQHTYDGCKNDGCDASTVDRLKLERTLAWTSLGVGVAALATAGVIWATQDSSGNSARIGVAPTRGGGGAWLSFAF